MVILALISALCLLLFLRLTGPLRFLPLLVGLPLMIALTGEVLMAEFGLSLPGAVLTAILLLGILIGLPAIGLHVASRQAERQRRERAERLAALRRHIDP